MNSSEYYEDQVAKYVKENTRCEICNVDEKSHPKYTIEYLQYY
jgi:hypothetical protein